MPDSKRDTPRLSPDETGATDLEKVDAHAITAEDYEEIPELTDAMMARAVPGDGLELLKRGRGRPRADQPNNQITLRLDTDVNDSMRASGDSGRASGFGWQVRANEALKKRFQR